MALTVDPGISPYGLQEELLKALASTAANGTDGSPLIKEDLEMEAHTQLWLETDPTELVILKHLPRKPAFSVQHQYDQITGYGPQGSTFFYGEASLPPEAAIQTRRRIEYIRLQGLISSVFALANFQTPIMALGQNNLVDQNMAAVRLALLRGMAVQTYSSNAATSTDGIRFRGIKQQLQEGTSFSTSAPYAPNPDYIIDMRGAPLTSQEIRNRTRQVVEAFGSMRWIYMAPVVKQFLEESLDPTERLYLSRGPDQPVIMGQNVDGMQSQGATVRFAVDNTLTSSQYAGSAPLSAVSGAPAPLPGGNLASLAASADASAPALWTTLDADAALLYDVTAMNAFGESTATRIGPVAAAAGQKVTFQLTPRAADTSYRVYRGGTAPNNPTIPMFIMEIAGPGNTTPFTVTDFNTRIPNTSEAFGLSVSSQNSELFMNQTNLSAVADRVTFGNAGYSRNTVSLVVLGPWMGIFDLAHILHTASRDLVFSAYTPEVTHPYQNVMWTNVGTRSL